MAEKVEKIMRQKNRGRKMRQKNRGNNMVGVYL
jgi:hypothetical protein